MKIVGQRLRACGRGEGCLRRRSVHSLAASSINRYESGEASAPYEVLLQYVTTDVSMDYIFGRTDNPQGKLYENKPKW